MNYDIEDLDADFAAINDANPHTHKEPAAPSPYSDVALSDLFVSLHGNNLRYVAKFDRWYVYQPAEGRWVEDIKLWAWTLAKRVVVSVAHEARALAEAGDKTVTAGTVKEILSARKVAAVISLARSHPRCAALDAQFDTDNWLLNTPNGAVDLRSGLLRDARREDYFTRVTKVGPKDTPTPIFDQFTLDIMGAQILPENCVCAACEKSSGKSEKDRLLEHGAEVCRLRDYLLRVYGHALTGDVREHTLFFQIGVGGNGKNVVNDSIGQDVVGTCPTGYSTDIPIEALLEAKGELHPTELMDLWHARLAFARESDEDTRWNEGRVKRLTGKDPIKARRMRQDYVTFPATHKLVIFGNVKPKLKGSDQAAWRRRLHLLMFPQKWDDAADEAKGILKADKELQSKLQVEAPGILHKLIQACLRWQAKGLDPPATVREASIQYLAEQSTVLQWIEDRVDTTNKYATVTVNELWPDFITWCERQKEDTCARRDFNDKLERCGIRITRTGGVRGICKGVTLKRGEEV